MPPILSPAHRVTVIGGDRRMLHAARRLGELGATVTLLGQNPSLADPSLRVSHTLPEAVHDATALLLPLPASRDGITVNCPFSPELSVSLAELSDRMRQNPDLLLYGGKLPTSFSNQNFSLSEKGFSRVIDYFTDEALTLRNAYLTAEGALMLAGRESECALRGTSAAIIGYGRIGKLLARLLLALGVEVTVCARRREALLWAVTDGCHPVRMGDTTRAGGGLFPLCCEHPIIFNTVPEPVLDRELLLRLEPNTLLIDLASPPYGVTDADAREAAERNSLRYIRAPGIPGQYAPRDAGYAIADCVAESLRSRGAPTTSPKGDTTP